MRKDYFAKGGKVSAMHDKKEQAFMKAKGAPASMLKAEKKEHGMAGGGSSGGGSAGTAGKSRYVGHGKYKFADGGLTPAPGMAQAGMLKRPMAAQAAQAAMAQRQGGMPAQPGMVRPKVGSFDPGMARAGGPPPTQAGMQARQGMAQAAQAAQAGMQARQRMAQAGMQAPNAAPGMARAGMPAQAAMQGRLPGRPGMDPNAPMVQQGQQGMARQAAMQAQAGMPAADFQQARQAKLGMPAQAAQAAPQAMQAAPAETFGQSMAKGGRVKCR